MASNLDRQKADLERLKKMGFELEMRMLFDLYPKENRASLEKQKMTDEDIDKLIGRLPKFSTAYQRWYSESLALIRQLIPDRFNDFKALYEVPKSRKEVAFGSYVMHDYLQGLRVTRGYNEEVVVDGTAALPQFRIQRSILEAAEARFESSLFEIASIVQADLLDSEVDAARVLLKNKFVRAAGAVAGVVLESHLKAVCANHSIKIQKQHPTIATLNDALKDNAVIDVAQWRYIQHLGDIRNLCDHKKDAEPTSAQVQDLVDGVAKVSKTVS